MQESGIVVKIEKDIAKVLFKRTSACGRCGACGMVKGTDEIVVDAVNTIDAKMGDRVVLEFSSEKSISATLIAYIFPLAMLLIGVFLGYCIGENMGWNKDLTGAVTGIALTVAAFIIIKLFEPRLKKKYAEVYVMKEFADEADQDMEDKDGK